MHTTNDAESQGEYPDVVPDTPGEYTDSVIPGDPPHPAADPGDRQFTDSDLQSEPDASGRQPEEGQYTDSQLADEPDAGDRDAPGTYTEADE